MSSFLRRWIPQESLFAWKWWILGNLHSVKISYSLREGITLTEKRNGSVLDMGEHNYQKPIFSNLPLSNTWELLIVSLQEQTHAQSALCGTFLPIDTNTSSCFCLWLKLIYYDWVRTLKKICSLWLTFHYRQAVNLFKKLTAIQLFGHVVFFVRYNKI